MAKFTQDLPRSNDPSYIGYSKEIDRPRPNNGLGSLFQGIGENLTLGITAVDESIQRDIRDAVYEGVDKRRGAQGVDEAVKFLPDSYRVDIGPVNDKVVSEGQPGGKRDSNAPVVEQSPYLKNYNSSISNLTSAYNQGLIRDSYYFSQLESLSRQLRSRFPGYREQVDAMISGVAGVNPANALRKSILADAQQAEAVRQSKQDEISKWVNSNASDLYTVTGGTFDFKNPTSQDIPMLKSMVAGLQAKRAEISDRKASNELAASDEKLAGQYAKGSAMDEVNMEVSNLIIGAGNSVSGLQKQVSDLVKRYGTDIPPAEKEAILAQLNGLRGQMSTKIDAMLTDPQRGFKGKSYAYWLKDQKDLDDVRKQGLRQIDLLMERVGAGDISIFGSVKRMNEATLDSFTRSLTKNNEIGMMVAASKLGLGPLLQQMFQSPEKNAQFHKHWQEVLTGMAATGQSEGASKAVDDLTRGQKIGKVTGKEAGEMFDNWSKIITHPEVGKSIDKQAASNTAKHLYGPQELNLLDKIDGNKNRMAVFQKVANPNVTAAMLKNFGKDSDEYRMYSNWVETQSMRLYSTALNSMKDISLHSDKFNIKFDEGTGQFVPELTPAGQQYIKDGLSGKNFDARLAINTIGGVPQPKWDVLMGSNGYKGFAEVNEMLRSYVPAMKGLGANPSQRLQYAIQGMGLDITGQTKEAQDSMAVKMYKGILGVLGVTEDDVSAWWDKSSTNPIKGFTDPNNPIWGNDKPRTKGKSSGLSTDATVQTASFAEGATAPLKEAIAGGESRGSYNVEYGGKDIGVTDMKINDILTYQNRMRKANGTPAWPVGKYQFVETTLRGLVKQLGLTGEETLTPELQEKMADALLERRGLKAYLAGDMDFNSFLSNLGDEWEAVKKDKRTFNKVFAAVDQLAKGE